MSLRNFLLLAVLVPMWAFAQSAQPAASNSKERGPDASAIAKAPNAITMQVIMAQKHTGISDEQWRKMMLEPVNASLYPIRLTQAILDTLDATQLDMRYQYIMSSADEIREHEGH